MPVAGVEPARVMCPTDFESASSANSNTPASVCIINPAQHKIKCFAHYELFKNIQIDGELVWKQMK